MPYVSAILYTYRSGLDRVGCNTTSLNRADIEYHPFTVDGDGTPILVPQK